MHPSRLNFNGEATRKLREEYACISLICLILFSAKNEKIIGISGIKLFLRLFQFLEFLEQCGLFLGQVLAFGEQHL